MNKGDININREKETMEIHLQYLLLLQSHGNFRTVFENNQVNHIHMSMPCMEIFSLVFCLFITDQGEPPGRLHCTAGDKGPVAYISCMNIFSHFQGLLTSGHKMVSSDLDFLLNSTPF